MEGFVGEESEGEGFFGVLWYAEVRGRKDLHSGQSRGNLSHDERVVGATAGDDELVDFGFGEDEAV